MSNSDSGVLVHNPLRRAEEHSAVSFCNTLIVDDKNMITGYKLRQKDGKKHAVEGFHSMNLKVFASGDSYNDLSMIKEADGGMLFCPPQKIVDENPTIGVARTYDELLAGIRKTIAQCR